MRRALEPICLGVVVAAQVALFTRLLSTALDFDEGVYLLSLAALRSGQHLGTDVFAPQPPAFYWLLRSIAATIGDQAERVRLGLALLAVLGIGAAWYLVRSIAGPIGGVLAAALLTISPPIPLFAARVLSDLPSFWIGLCALALGALASRRGSNAAAVAAGAIAAVAVATKVSAIVAIPILVVVLLAGGGRPLRRLAWAVAGAVVAAGTILAVNARALGDLWDSVVVYHRKAASTPAVIDRWHSIHDLFNPRTPAFWLVIAGGVVFVLRIVRRRARIAEIALWAWSLAAFVFLARYAPLHYNHLVALPVPLALAAATSLGAQVAAAGRDQRTVAVSVLAIVVTAGYVQQWHRVAIAGEPQSQTEIAAAAALERVTRRTDVIVTDLPVSGVLADRVVPGPLVDTAFLRFETGSLTPELVLAEIDRWCVRAVVVGRSLADQPAVVRGLRKRFARSSPASGATVFSDRRRPCTPQR